MTITERFNKYAKKIDNTALIIIKGNKAEGFTVKVFEKYNTINTETL